MFGRLFSGRQRRPEPPRPDPPTSSTSGFDNGGGGGNGSKYIMLGPVGDEARGGQGVLWHALHKPSGRRVACKRIQVEPEDQDKLTYAIREAITMDLLDGGPHIIRIHDSEVLLEKGQCEIRIYTDFYRGGDLSGVIIDCVCRRVRIPEASIVAIARQIAEALSFCHVRGFWHRDLKPNNVLLEAPWQRPESQSPPDILLIDFGLARFAGNATSTYSSIVGTRGFHTPELRDTGASSAEGDIFNFGQVLYCLMALTVPNSDDGMENLPASRLPRTYSSELRELVAEMLKRNRYHRPSADEISERLRYMG